MIAANPNTLERITSDERTVLELWQSLGLPPIPERKVKFHCPLHDDKDPSMSMFQRADGRLHFKCHAGCVNGTIIDIAKIVRECTDAQAIQWARDATRGRVELNPFTAPEPKPEVRFQDVYGRRFPQLAQFTDSDTRAFNKLRGADFTRAIELMGRRGMLRAGDYRNHRAFFIGDREGLYAQAQALDPAVTFPTEDGPTRKKTIGQGLRQPLGLHQETPFVLFVRGNTDAIAAHELITRAAKPSDVSVVTLLGDGQRVGSESLERLSSAKRIVILPDNDKPGQRAGGKLHGQLEEAGIPTTRLTWGPLAECLKVNGKPMVKDVGDLVFCALHASDDRGIRPDILHHVHGAIDWVLSQVGGKGVA